jgi:transposase
VEGRDWASPDYVDTNRQEDTVFKMAKSKQAPRPRRTFTDEFKAGAVRLVLDEGRSVASVARDLDLSESAFARWVAQARIDRGGAPATGAPATGALTTDERTELVELRRRTRQLEMERDILKKATAFFAKEST